MLALKENTCAIIVTFNPDEEFLDRLALIENQVGYVIVVDNHSKKKISQQNNKKRMILQNSSNLGIASALNQGLGLAEKLGLEWIVTFDQDSTVESHLVKSLCEISNKTQHQLSIIGSNYWNANKKGLFYNCNVQNTGYDERKTVITSGMFFHINLIKKIGRFKDDYFIDSVDHEFCLRARQQQCKVYISCIPLMSHSIGEKKSEKALLNSLVFLHSADRVYYMARNTLTTVKKFVFREPVWVMRQILRLGLEFTAIAFTRDERSKKISAFIRGLRDGVQGHMGRIKKPDE